MRALAVVAQALAVVAGDHDQRPVAQSGRAEAFEQTAELRVHVRDLAVVEGSREPRGEGLGRAVRGVGVEVMDPGHEGARAVAGPDPGQGRVGRASGPPLVGAGREGGALRRLHAVVIDVEALVQAKARVQDERGDERPGLVSPPARHLGQRHVLRGQVALRVDPDAVAWGQETGQEGGMGGQRLGGHGHRLREADPSGRQAVQDRRGGAPVPVAADAVGARGVERHQEDVEAGRRAGGNAQDRLRARERTTGRKRAQAGQDQRRHEPAGKHGSRILPG
jgi:hypothetical protein